MNDHSSTIAIDTIRIAASCNARWDDMVGDERTRFCGSCRKNVFNLSAMSRSEIEALVRRTEGKFCGRFYRRADGRMLTADCPTGSRRRRNRLAAWCSAVFAMVLLWFGAKASPRAIMLGKIKATKSEPPELLGSVAVSPIQLGYIGTILQPTNAVGAATNEFDTNVMMGEIALPRTTNSTDAPKD